MTIPAPATDRDVLDALAPLLVQAYEHGGGVLPARDIRGHFSDVDDDNRLYLPDQVVRGIRRQMRAARDHGLTVRQIASHARVPAGQVLRWIDDPRERAEAYAAEIHHLERAAAVWRLQRAREVDALYRDDPATGRKGMTKVALAELYRVSRPTIDAWLQDAQEPAFPHSHG